MSRRRASAFAEFARRNSAKRRRGRRPRVSAAAGIAAADDATSCKSLAIDNLTTLTVKHWNRILEGELFATSSVRQAKPG